jgi:putative transposase
MYQAHDIDISMDGKGRWIDNVFVERLWRSVKYENGYLRAYETPAAFRAGLHPIFRFLQRTAPSHRHWTAAPLMRSTSSRSPPQEAA